MPIYFTLSIQGAPFWRGVKLRELKKGFDEQLSEILQKQRIADDQVSTVRTEMRHLIDRVMSSSRHAETEAREETVREHIVRQLRVLRRHQPTTTADDLVSRLRDQFPPRRIVVELERMISEGLVSASTTDSIAPSTEIRLTSPSTPSTTRPPC